MKIYKRFIGAGMYVKREDDAYWLGHYCSKNKVVRIRISKEIYDALLKQRSLVFKRKSS